MGSQRGLKNNLSQQLSDIVLAFGKATEMEISEKSSLVSTTLFLFMFSIETFFSA